MILFQQLLVYLRFVIEALYMAERNELYQIVVSLQIFRQQYKVVCTLIFPSTFGEPAFRVYIDFASDNRFDVWKPLCNLEKFLYTEHVSVVGDCKCRLVVCSSPLEKAFNGRSSVKDRVIAVYVKMDKWHT